MFYRPTCIRLLSLGLKLLSPFNITRLHATKTTCIFPRRFQSLILAYKQTIHTKQTVHTQKMPNLLLSIITISDISGKY